MLGRGRIGYDVDPDRGCRRFGADCHYRIALVKVKAKLVDFDSESLVLRLFAESVRARS